MGFIYKITNKITQKCYIGETTADDPQKRWNAHIQTMKSNKGCPALKDAMKKYGVENFKFEVIIICFDEDVYRYEQEYIQKYNSIVPNGYNILAGGQCGGGFKGKTHTPEAIAKMMESCRKFREANPNHFETYREKLRKSMEKVNLSEAINKSERFQQAKKEGRLGTRSHKKINEDGTMADETRQKIRESVLRYYHENKQNKSIPARFIDPQKHKEAVIKALGKPIDQFTKEGEFIASHITTTEAAKTTKVKIKNISNALRRSNATAGGFIWRYAPKPT
jgi:group I intron endonuclease